MTSPTWIIVSLLLVFWCTSVSLLLVFCLSSVGLLLVICWSSVGHLLVICWSSVGHLLVICCSSVGHLLVGLLLVSCWSSVGLPMFFYWSSFVCGSLVILVFCQSFVGLTVKTSKSSKLINFRQMVTPDSHGSFLEMLSHLKRDYLKVDQQRGPR